ncbi:MAG: NUDIX hydrolase [Gemmatimonadaceae bacterium]
MSPVGNSGSGAPRKQGTKLPIRDQVSAGGVVFRQGEGGISVVIISVGSQRRWQLPKGLVDKGEKPEVAAVREAREEAGVESEIVSHIETVEYWYAGIDGGERVRFHKRVHFFLLRYLGGDTKDHDWEVNEARWVPIEDAISQLAFDNERRVMEVARDRIVAGS